MKNHEKEIDIPFGAFDSELHYQEINIPSGFEASIKDNKIILKRKENEDEEICQSIIDDIEAIKEESPECYINLYNRCLGWLKTLKERIGG